MPFLRFSRDKRGYEHFYLIHSTTRRGKSRSRILYWFRTPPNVKVGREPFDEELRRALEAQNPEVTFDWDQLVATPIPPPVEPERWRERRRVEKAAKLEAQVEAAARAVPSEPQVAEDPEAAAGLAPVGVADQAPSADAMPPPVAPDMAAATEPLGVSDVAAPAPQAQQARRRRRGRRGRRSNEMAPAIAGSLTAGLRAPMPHVESAEPFEPFEPFEPGEPGEPGEPSEDV